MRAKQTTMLCAALLVPALASCGSDAEGTAETQDQSDGSGLDVTAQDTPSSSEPAEPTVDFSGLVQVGNWAGGGELRVVDPMSPDGGVEAKTEIELPFTEAGYTRESFSPDWHYVAWTTDAGAVQVAELDPVQRRYVTSFTIKPTKGGYSTKSTSYAHPTFSPDGTTLWIEAIVEGDNLNEWHTLASVPYTDYRPGDTPQLTDLKTSDMEGSYDDQQWWMFDQNGDPILSRELDRHRLGNEYDDPIVADYWTDQTGSIVKLEIGTAIDPTDEAYLGYHVVEQLGPEEFMVAPDPEAIGFEREAQKYGAVARATVDTAGRRVALEPMVPLGVGGVPEWVMVSPDRTEAVLCVHRDRGAGYVPYLADLQRAAEPQLLSREECADTGFTQLGWY
jgi:hypothetical protein